MNMLGELSTYYFTGALAIVILTFIGLALFRILRVSLGDNHYATFSVAPLLSLILIVVCFSLAITRAQTVMLAMIPVLVLIYLQWSGRAIESTSTLRTSSVKQMLIMILSVYSILFLLKWYLLFATTDLLATPHPDEVFNSMVSSYISKTGIENFSLDYFYPETHSAQPYHYFELWTAGLLSYVTGLNNLYVLTLVVYPILLTITFVGMCGIMRSLIPSCNTIVLISCATFGLLVMGMFFPIYESVKFLNVADTFTRSVFNYPKLSVIYAFLVVSLQLFLNDQKKSAIISILLLPIVFISTAPATLAGFSIFVAADFYLSRSSKDFAYNSLALSLVTLIFLIQYVWLPQPEATASYHGGIFDQITLDTAYFRTSFNVIAGTTIQFLILYAPVILVAFICWKRQFLSLAQKNYSLLSFVLIAMLSLLAWATLHNMPDAVQLFSNFSVAFINISTCYFLFYFAVTLQDLWKKIAVIGVILLMSGVSLAKLSALLHTDKATSCATDLFYQQVKEHVNSGPFGVAFIRDSTEYNSIFSKNSSFSIPAPYLVKMNREVFFTSLSVFEIPLEITSPLYPYEKRMVESAPFYAFVKSQKKSGEYINIRHSVHDFITKFHIRCLIYSQPSVTKPDLREETLFEIKNPCGQETLVFLK